MSVSAPAVKSRSTWSASRCSCRESRTKVCWVSTSCCTDSDMASSEREMEPMSAVAACCSCRLSVALWASCSCSKPLCWGGIAVAAEPGRGGGGTGGDGAETEGVEGAAKEPPPRPRGLESGRGRSRSDKRPVAASRITAPRSRSSNFIKLSARSTQRGHAFTKLNHIQTKPNTRQDRDHLKPKYC